MTATIPAPVKAAFDFIANGLKQEMPVDEIKNWDFAISSCGDGPNYMFSVSFLDPSTGGRFEEKAQITYKENGDGAGEHTTLSAIEVTDEGLGFLGSFYDKAESAFNLVQNKMKTER